MAELGQLMAMVCGDISKMLIVLADLDPQMAEGVQAQITQANEDVFSDVGRADISREYAYDVPQTVIPGGLSQSPNKELLDGQGIGDTNEKPAVLHDSKTKEGDGESVNSPAASTVV